MWECPNFDSHLNGLKTKTSNTWVRLSVIYSHTTPLFLLYLLDTCGNWAFLLDLLYLYGHSYLYAAVLFVTLPKFGIDSK